MTTWTLLVNVSLKSTLVLAIAWAAAFALRGRSAAARHMVWTGAAAALLALPLLSISLPEWHHPIADAVLPSGAGITFQTAANDASAAPGRAVPVPRSTAPARAASTPLDLRSALVYVWAA